MQISENVWDNISEGILFKYTIKKYIIKWIFFEMILNFFVTKIGKERGNYYRKNEKISGWHIQTHRSLTDKFRQSQMTFSIGR